MSEVHLKQRIDAPTEIVWDILSDHRGYSDWTLVRRAELEREGDPAPNGVGAIRALHALGPPIREQIELFEPPTRMDYSILSGMPVRDYLARATLTPSGSGTEVDYFVTFTPRFPGVQLGVRASLTTMIRGLKKTAEKRASSA